MTWADELFKKIQRKHIVSELEHEGWLREDDLVLAVQKARKEELRKFTDDKLKKMGLDTRVADAYEKVIEARVRRETAKEIFQDFDSNFYYEFRVGKKSRVNIPREWYDEIKKRFLSEGKHE